MSDPREYDPITDILDIIGSSEITDSREITSAIGFTGVGRAIRDVIAPRSVDDTINGSGEDFFPFVDVHSHLTPLQFMPDDVVENTVYRATTFRIPYPIIRYASDLVEAAPYFGLLPPGFVDILRSFDVVDRPLETLDAMSEDDSSALINVARSDMFSSGVDIMVPKALDLWYGSGSKDEGTFSYEEQVKQLLDCIPSNPWKFLPFVMFEPRRPGAVQLVKDALSKGAVGVKFYPAMGYNPDPNSDMNARKVNIALNELYEHCDEFKVPITTHCTAGGAMPGHAFDVDWSGIELALLLPPELLLIEVYKRTQEAWHKGQREKVWPFTNPTNWYPVLERFDIKVNLAHMGSGNWWQEDDEIREKELEWMVEIFHLMRSDLKGKAYTDLSSDEAMCLGDNKDVYFNFLKVVLQQDPVKSRIMFGIDWPLNRVSHSMAEYCEAYSSNLGSFLLCQIASTNPVEFIFGESKKIPDAYVGRIPVEHQRPEALPRYIEKRDDGFYIKTKAS
jgi:predicted TIM-barrel fold metal-dependent hydrolase